MMSSPFPNTFIFGGDSFIGSKLYSLYKAEYRNIRATSRRKHQKELLYYDLDYSSFSSLDVNWDEYKQAIFCFGATKLSFCEKHKKGSFEINVSHLLHLAHELHQRKIKPIFFSSDLVFDGSKEHYDDESLPNPLNEYGRQKYALEQKIPIICPNNYLILRLSKVYDSAENNSSLLFDIIKQFLTQPEVFAAVDYYFCPTALCDVTWAIQQLQIHNYNGIYNIAGEELISWHDLCHLIAQIFNFSSEKIKPIKLHQLNPNIKRPSKVRLLSRRFKQHFPDFKFTQLKEHLNQIKRLNLIENSI